MSPWPAFAGFAVCLVLVAGTELILRFDRWMRAHGLSSVVVGGRRHALTIAWAIRAVVGVAGVYFLVVFFERI
ncbi:MAG TPA: hypothetical protein VGG88_07640 [Gaiellaceae bacterium]|jgi:uncharacterized membrane protein YecN with MAPEG domain